MSPPLNMKIILLSAVAGVAALAVMATAQKTVLDHDKVVSCYVGTWAFYRPGEGKFDIDDIDPNLCTHGFYGFADLDNITWTIYSYDPWFDLAPEDCEPGYCNFDSYRRFVALKDINPNFVPMLSIGGWNAGSGKYSLMAKDDIKRATFIASVVPFAREYGFEGIDFDWEYPGSREGTDADMDYLSYNYLIDEMKMALEPYGMLLTAALSPGKGTIDIAYDVPFIMSRLDFANIMCYDYHGWFPDHYFTGHNAPLMRRPEENYEGHPGYYFNVYDTMMYYQELGAPVEKMVMGMPSYGRGFHIYDIEDDGLYCPADDGIRMGPYTRQKGTWGYNEVLQALHNDTLENLPGAEPHSWKIVVDGCYQAPYMVNDQYWFSYDDEASIAMKTKFVNFLDVAGAMVWSLETDDFGGFDSDRKYPLLHTINEVLASGETYDPDQADCSSAPMCDLFIITTTPETTTTTTPETTTTTTAEETTTTQGGLEGTCTENWEVLPYPGDCHLYYMCQLQDDGSYTVHIYDCGDWAFNPNTDACVDPELPGNSLLCGPEG